MYQKFHIIRTFVDGLTRNVDVYVPRHLLKRYVGDEIESYIEKDSAFREMTIITEYSTTIVIKTT